MNEADDVSKHVTFTLHSGQSVGIAFDDGRQIRLSAAEAGFVHQALYDFCSTGSQGRCVCFASGVEAGRYDTTRR
jgi:hypothetical protein